MSLFAVANSFGQQPVIGSLGKSGILECTNLQPGTVASIAQAPSVQGPWSTNWTNNVVSTADSNGTIRISVPISGGAAGYYRVLGTPAFRIPVDMGFIPAGSFLMGNSKDQSEGLAAEVPRHPVQVSAFYMDKYLVSKALWDKVYTWGKDHGYDYEGTSYGYGKGPNHPVYGLTWWAMLRWCNARSEMEGRVPAYYTNAEQTAVYRSGSVNVQNGWVKWNAGYRLPTEAEWEKSARGGVEGARFPWGDYITWADANYYSYLESYDLNPTKGNAPAYDDGHVPYTSPVGTFAPNGYGLYDMVGNMTVWCWDGYGDYGAAPQTDPRGQSDATYRVYRGGGWNGTGFNCRTAYRLSAPMGNRDNTTSLRTVLPPPQ